MDSGNDFNNVSSSYLCNLLSESHCDVDCDVGDSFCVDDICTDFLNIKAPDLQDIELYLECNDDGNYTMPCAEPSPAQLQTAIIAKNVNFRVSFPTTQEEAPTPLLWECPFCSKSMKKETLRNKHVRDIHGVPKPFNCKLCVYSSSCQKLLTRHYKRKHKVFNIMEISCDDKDFIVAEQVEEIGDTRTEGKNIGGVVPPSNRLCKYKSKSGEKTTKLYTGINSQEIYIEQATCQRLDIKKNENMKSGSEQVLEDIADTKEEKSEKKNMKNGSVDHDMENKTEPISEIREFEELEKGNSDQSECSKEGTDHPNKWEIVKSGEPDSTRKNTCVQDNSGESVSNTIKSNDCVPANVNICSVEEKAVFKCSSCAYVGKTKKLLRTHHKTMHSVSRDLYRCEECEYSCKQKRYFKEHLKNHRGELEFCCSVCQKHFISQTALKRHSISHNTLSAYKCKEMFCEKMFKTQSALTAHVQTVHNGNRKLRPKNIPCTVEGCHKRFRDKHGLKIHLCCHSGEKPLKCCVCDYQCVQRNSMDWHIKSKHVEL